MKQRRTLIIRRDDHLADPLGALFLVAPEKIEDSIVEKLKSYLGNRVRLLRVIMSGTQIEAEVESQGLHEESQRLVAAAAGLRARGLGRSALATLKDALDLDPLNGHAYLEIGATLAAAEKTREALATFVRAREILGHSGEILIAIAECCLKLERTSAGIAYLEHALKVEPRNFRARRLLAALGRKREPEKGRASARQQGPAEPRSYSDNSAQGVSRAHASSKKKAAAEGQLPLLRERHEGEGPPRKPGGSSGD